jgi:hypothetical protein
MTRIVPFFQDDAFDPDALRVMSLALEEACRELRVDGDQHAREAMAVRILELARHGERDPERLRDGALRGAGATPSKRHGDDPAKLAAARVGNGEAVVAHPTLKALNDNSRYRP